MLGTPRSGLLSLGAALTLWTASSAFGAVINGLNRAYRAREHRPWWRLRLEAIGRLWDAVTDAATGDAGNVGFCLDTCHANSAGIDLADAVDRVKAITGRIDLVHCNNSRDEFGSGRDRHAGMETGTIDPGVLADLVRAAGAPVICETPDPAVDIDWLRAHVPGAD